MSGRFVRASKYRHVYGRPSKKANPKFLSINWEASGGGAFAVIPLHEKGRLPEHIPLFRGHTAPVLDTDWSPFDDHLIASGSDDGKVFLWRVPEDFSVHTPEGAEASDISPYAKLTGHSRKVGHVLFSPSASNVLATSAGDFAVKLWDITKNGSQSKSLLTLSHGDVVQSLSFACDSSLLVTTCRDKKLRIWDPRQQKPAQEVPGHAGAKNSRAVWMGEQDRIATTGFSKMSDRQMGLWDVRNTQQGPIGGFENLDSMSGACIPFWDEGTKCLYLAGKGDGNIRYFEFENGKFEFLSEYKSADPQRGIAFIPKRGVNTHENEVLRAFKTVSDSYVEPISFIVPRRAEVFQNDIYPPCTGSRPGCTAEEWFAGTNAMAPKIDLESLYDGNGEGEVVTEAVSKPTPTSTITAPAPAPAAVPAATPTKKDAVETDSSPAKPQPGATPVAYGKGPPPSLKEHKRSLSQLASKYVDNDEDDTKGGAEDEDDEDSGFNEPPRTLGVSVIGEPRVAPVRKLGGEHIIPASPTKARYSPTKASAPREESKSTGTPASTPTTHTAAITSPSPSKPSTIPASTTKATTAVNATPPAPIESSLQEIHKLLESQNQLLAQQNEKIGMLMGEVDSLRKTVNTSSGKSEDETLLKDRIRELEAQLERERARGSDAHQAA